MEELRTLLLLYMDQKLQQVVLSKAAKGAVVSKVKIRPVMLRGTLLFQITRTQGTKELHSNVSRQEAVEQVLLWMQGDFGQLQLTAAGAEVSALVSKKGKVTVKCRKHPTRSCPVSLEHNRTKDYVLPVGKPVDFLVDLGVMRPDGQIVRSKYDKFRQINRFLEFIRDVLPNLERDRELVIVDFGCGKSYLTFAMYYYLHVVLQYHIRVIGLDLKEDVIRHCGSLAQKYGFEGLQFHVGDIASFERQEPVDMVVTLHACDTATDYALARAVEWDASVILSVPCCQHELNGQIRNELLEPVLSYGILKERMAALLTDGVRAQLLEEQGYDTQILEFIDMEHTPKNLLIRAVKARKPVGRSQRLAELLEALHADLTLGRLLDGREEAGGDR